MTLEEARLLNLSGAAQDYLQLSEKAELIYREAGTVTPEMDDIHKQMDALWVRMSEREQTLVVS